MRLHHPSLLHTEHSFPIINIVGFLKHRSVCCLDSQNHVIFPFYISSHSFILLRLLKKKNRSLRPKLLTLNSFVPFSVLAVFTGFLHFFIFYFDLHFHLIPLLIPPFIVWGPNWLCVIFFFFFFQFPVSPLSLILCALLFLFPFISSCSSKISPLCSSTFGYFSLLSFSFTTPLGLHSLHHLLGLTHSSYF